jgi:hypothetical protein
MAGTGGTGKSKERNYMNNKDKMAELYEALPKLDCGICGYNSCWEYAWAMAEGKAPPSLCVSGGPKVNYRLQEITGAVAVSQPRSRRERREGMAGRYRFAPTRESIFHFEPPGRRPSFREQRYKEIDILKNRIKNLRSQLDRIEFEIRKSAGDK